jgi:hypothetical protein
VDKTDPDPKALACYGMLETSSGRMHLRFVSGRPARGVTTDFLEWLCEQVQAQDKQVLVLIWDNASWHNSQAGQSLAASAQSDGVARNPHWQSRRAHYPRLSAHQEPPLSTGSSRNGSMANERSSNLLGF